MLAYAIRRLAYGFLVVQGVLGLLFVLFFLYAKPIDIARRAVGEKAPPEVLQTWIAQLLGPRAVVAVLLDPVVEHTR